MTLGGVSDNICGMGKPQDLTGRVFGRLKVLADSGQRDGSNHVGYLCQCECGNLLIVTSVNLTRGKTTSCGCAARKMQVPPDTPPADLQTLRGDNLRLRMEMRALRRELDGLRAA